MISVTIVGKGNLGTHLYKAFQKKSLLTVTQVNSRQVETLTHTDIVIIAIADDAIAEVSSKITSPFVVHTSGTTHINQLKNIGRKGVFYPLQSFSKNKKIDFSCIPFCLKTENTEDIKLLEELVMILGAKPYHIDSNQRKYIHIAAVFANNFTNHMYQLAQEVCDANNVPFEILQPLILETAEKVKNISPKEAQTGPAIRNDQKIIKNHLNLLNGLPKEIYQKLTESIQKHGKKL